MDAKKGRRRIILDNSVVPRFRRSESGPKIDKANKETHTTQANKDDANCPSNNVSDGHAIKQAGEVRINGSKQMDLKVMSTPVAVVKKNYNIGSKPPKSPVKEEMPNMTSSLHVISVQNSTTESRGMEANGFDNVIQELSLRTNKNSRNGKKRTSRDQGQVNKFENTNLDETFFVPLSKTISLPRRESDVRSQSSLYPGTTFIKGKNGQIVEECAKSEITMCESPVNLEFFEKRNSHLKDLFGTDEAVSSITSKQDSRTGVKNSHSAELDRTLRCYNPGGLFDDADTITCNSKLFKVHNGIGQLNNFEEMYKKMYDLEQQQESGISGCGRQEPNVDKDIDDGQIHGTCPETTDSFQHTDHVLETKDPFSIELELTKARGDNTDTAPGNLDKLPDLFAAMMHDYERDRQRLEARTACKNLQDDEGTSSENEDSYSNLMEGSNGTPRLLSVEEKWQIIFNEKTRAPIYAVAQYIEYLTQFVNGQNVASRDTKDGIKKDGIHPISYLLRKLKLDLKMSYDSFLEEFLRSGNSGMSLLIKLLKSIQNTETRQSGSTNKTQLKNYKKTLTDEHDCLLCIKYTLRLKIQVMINYGLETVASSLISTFTKSRGTAIEILTVAMSASEGFSRILDCFTYIQLKIGEPVRFKSLMNMMNMDSQQNTIFKVSTMKFLNTLLDASTNTNIRVYLQHELETAGLDINYMIKKASGTGLEFDDLRHELSEWGRKYVNVDTLLTQRGSVLQKHEQTTQEQSLVEGLQQQVNRLSEEKSNLQRQLKQVSHELKSKHEELRRRNQNGCDAFTQCHPSHTESVGCQCTFVEPAEDYEDPLITSGQMFGWKDVYVNDTEEAVYYPQSHHDHVDAGGGGQVVYHVDTGGQEQIEDAMSDEEGVVKVQDWLRSHCSDENCDRSQTVANNNSGSDSHAFYFKRNSMTRRQVRKAEFPGNWKLIPKSIEQFPSRFSQHQCHQSECDRCDIRNRPENAQNHTRKSVDQSIPVELRLNDLVTNKKRSDIKSQSSDSAIGGSGERLWNERRIALLPAGVSEAEILQELIQPEDSASACPVNEPFPDYAIVRTGYDTHKSYNSELSQVLRDFEGTLSRYDSPVKPPINEVVEQYVNLGKVRYV